MEFEDLRSFSGALSPNELEALVRIASTTSRINTIEDLEIWTKTIVKDFFPHEMLFCGAGRVEGVKVRIERVIGFGYPPIYLKSIGSATNLLERPVLKHWLTQMRPQIIDECEVGTVLSTLEREEVEKYGLVNIAAFGVVDVNVGRGTYFSFSRVPGPLTNRHAQLLEMVVPYLHQALMRTVDKTDALGNVEQRLSLLTQKEKEILELLTSGMTNKEIAIALCRSELTVQTHVHSLLSKLDVPNRSAATALVRGAGFGKSSPQHDV
jgi:transcriptional regulator EpsA